MSNKKMIPCRVCGKSFEPCVICQAYNDMFRWRNFACSRECAEKYIAATIAYRASLKKDKNSNSNVVEEVSSKVDNIDKKQTTKRKYNRKKSTDDVEIINEEREQID